MTRSSRAEVRNPILALPGWGGLVSLLNQHPEVKAALVALLKALSEDCRMRAEKCWRTHKAPMALYWKGTGVWAGHIARALARA